jgi:hypothetical protein
MNGTNDLVYALNQRVYAPGSLGVGTVTDESKVRFVITNAGLSNLVRVRARVNNQPNWTTLIDFTGNVNEAVDVFTWDELEVLVLVYQSLSDQVSIVASSFDGANVSISTPGGDLLDVNTMHFTSSDSSITITADDSTNTIDFITVGGGDSTPYTQDFIIGDWVGPSLGAYTIIVPFATHSKQDPIIEVFETIVSDNELVNVNILVDVSFNITISVSSDPDLRFAGKIIIS